MSFRKETRKIHPYRSVFGNAEVADDKVGQLFFVGISDGDVVVDLHFALGCRPILDAHDLSEKKEGMTFRRGTVLFLKREPLTLMKSKVLVSITMQLA